MSQNVQIESPNPPFVLTPVKPMSLEELMAYHKRAGTLIEFLARMGLSRGR